MPASAARSRSCGAVAAPPSRTALSRAKAATASAGPSSRTLASWPGTRDVYPRSPPSVQASTAAGRAAGPNPRETSTITGSWPARRERSITWIPAMWWPGRVRIHRPGPRRAGAVAAAGADRAVAGSIAALGGPGGVESAGEVHDHRLVAGPQGAQHQLDPRDVVAGEGEDPSARPAQGEVGGGGGRGQRRGREHRPLGRTGRAGGAHHEGGAGID